MSARDLVVIGAGEHARVVIEAATASGQWRVVGVIDDRAIAVDERLGVSVLELEDTFIARLRATPLGRRPALALGIGPVVGRADRQRVVAKFESTGEWATVIHPTAWVSPTASVKDGSAILAGAIVNGGARIGRHTVINTRVVVEHDVEVGDFVHLAPGATIGGGVRLGTGAYVGLGALVRDHVVVGEGAVVGMGVVALRDVAPGATETTGRERPRSQP